MLLIYFLWWEKPFEVDYPSTIIEDKILWGLRALLFMCRNKSRVVELYVQELKACVENDTKWQAVPEVRFFRPNPLSSKVRVAGKKKGTS